MARHVARLAAVHLITVAAVAAVVPIPVSAEESSLQLEVTASVANVCTIESSNGGLDFGRLEIGEPNTASTTLTISCSFGANASVKIDNGQNFNVNRRLKYSESGPFIPYSLCPVAPIDGGCAADWNDEDGETVSVDTGAGGSVTVHALITSTGTDGIGQEGDYTDTLQVTVEL